MAAPLQTHRTQFPASEFASPPPPPTWTTCPCAFQRLVFTCALGSAGHLTMLCPLPGSHTTYLTLESLFHWSWNPTPCAREEPGVQISVSSGLQLFQLTVLWVCCRATKQVLEVGLIWLYPDLRLQSSRRLASR